MGLWLRFVFFFSSRRRHTRCGRDWSSDVCSSDLAGPFDDAPRSFAVPPHRALPVPAADLPGRCWVAVNSPGSARTAGELGFNVLFSHLRTPGQYREYAAAYRAAGGAGLIAANRPVFVGPDDATALRQA